MTGQRGLLVHCASYSGYRLSGDAFAWPLSIDKKVCSSELHYETQFALAPQGCTISIEMNVMAAQSRLVYRFILITKLLFNTAPMPAFTMRSTSTIKVD